MHSGTVIKAGTPVVAAIAAVILSVVLTPAPARAQMELRDGDTVVFLGGSVVQQHRFTALTEAFLRIRYPERKVHFLNFGHAGDTAALCADRLKDEVLPFKPTVAVVCFGLAEGNFQPFDRPVYEKFKADYKRLLDELDKAKVRVVVCTPTAVDQTRKYQNRDLSKYNETMAKYADFCRREAGARKLVVADFFSALQTAEDKGRNAKPAWSCFEPQTGVLLGNPGHLVLTSALLRALGAHDHTGRMEAELKDRTVEYVDVRSGGEKGGRQTMPWSGEAGAVLVLKDIRRPVPLFAFGRLPGGREAAAVVSTAGRMNELAVRIRGLPSGEYHLRLDGRPLGTYTAGQLAGEIPVIAKADKGAADLLDDDLERLWAGIALKDGLHLERCDLMREAAAAKARADAELAAKSAKPEAKPDPKSPAKSDDKAADPKARPAASPEPDGKPDPKTAAKSDPPVRTPQQIAARRQAVEREFDDVVRRLDAFNGELARPMRLAVLPGQRGDDKQGPPPTAVKAGKLTRVLLGDRYYLLYLPKEWKPERKLPLVVWLHADHSAPEPFEGFCRRMAEQRQVVVALPCAWNSDWAARYDGGFLSASLVDPIVRRLDIDPARVFLVGHGAGASVAAELCLAEPARYRGVIAASMPGLREDLAGKGKGLLFVLLHGTNDKVVPFAEAEKNEKRLAGLGAEVLIKKHDRERRIPDVTLDEALRHLLEKTTNPSPAKPD